MTAYNLSTHMSQIGRSRGGYGQTAICTWCMYADEILVIARYWY